jgi:hypothetical protein
LSCTAGPESEPIAGSQSAGPANAANENKHAINRFNGFIDFSSSARPPQAQFERSFVIIFCWSILGRIQNRVNFAAAGFE